jgi:hypothetical protein
MTDLSDPIRRDVREDTFPTQNKKIVAVHCATREGTVRSARQVNMPTNEGGWL